MARSFRSIGTLCIIAFGFAQWRLAPSHGGILELR